MYYQKKFYINGEWVNPISSETLAVVNPATEQEIGSIVLGSTEDVDKAVAAAKQAFQLYGQTSVGERVSLLQRIIEAYQDHYDEIAQAISDEMGAPIGFAKQLQADAGVGHLAAALEVLKRYRFEEVVGDSVVYKEPIGVCGLITPWNWPLNQIACKVAPALATGCTVVLKPSEIAPLSATVFAKVMDEAGVPAGVFNLVHGDGKAVGTRLSNHPDVDMVSFTGSTAAGIQVAKTAADSVKRVAQELGGKSANIILADADLTKAVEDGVLECFLNTGQSCNAPSRMLVPAHLHDEIVALAQQVADSLVIGDPSDEATTMGPLASEMQFNKVQQLIAKAIEQASHLAYGGLGKPQGCEQGYFVKPTIFSHVSNDMLIAREEIFGPVLAIMPYSDEQQALDIANDSPYGLSGYIHSGDTDKARAMARKLRTGMVHINGALADFQAPFGGYKQSGNGREWGVYGFEDFVEVKAVMG
ncbi:aldehyde dehydrogenase family protein [Dasania sp. GY-MA-18]|uniref:aldehyde dehydrogenase (NAD(+)) n=1 Tax=Dasania phycosphaerae TaxID=2950436 RepID=A0A9J6RR76_9GAMM|nr:MULTISPECIES: aldehyde dehydrogenase family protein [Dasania]MCR8924082.1 aldehyde dehydrogenase family protein [Dasania sp. GY-MA-18]MCZ0866655.1 aldehyde dehydrogenase family protein [Dasania phycosphaerae]MCZ0870240.1 aldehyde dehydrogenase family protein [Dasania phycosphaerae]